MYGGGTHESQVPSARCFASSIWSMIRAWAAAIACGLPSSVSGRVNAPGMDAFGILILAPDCACTRKYVDAR